MNSINRILFNSAFLLLLIAGTIIGGTTLVVANAMFIIFGILGTIVTFSLISDKIKQKIVQNITYTNRYWYFSHTYNLTIILLLIYNNLPTASVLYILSTLSSIIVHSEQNKLGENK